MKPYPHTYTVTASGVAGGLVSVSAAGVPSLDTGPPPEFDGPGGIWSPESLLVAAVADCFILTFRAVARAASFPWERLVCEVDGVLERTTDTTRFTRYVTHARLTVPIGADDAKARALLERAEKACLVANSLSGARSLDIEIVIAPG